jgi:hypothetical protein
MPAATAAATIAGSTLIAFPSGAAGQAGSVPLRCISCISPGRS